MDSCLGFPHKSIIYYNPGWRSSSRKTPGTIRFSPVLSSINASSSRERLSIASCGGHFRFQSSNSGSFVQQTLNAPKNLHKCNRTAAASARSFGLSASGQMETGDALEDEVPEDVPEFQLSGDETQLSEVNFSFFSIRTAKTVIFKVRDIGQQFVMNNIAGVVGLLTMFQKQPEPEVLQLRTAMIEQGDGAAAVQKWSATELTMQHGQLARIAMDMNYLVFAFGFFGWVRILEAILAVFSTNPPVLKRMVQSFYAVDYLTIAWLAHNLRKPILSILQVDPLNLHEVSILKAKVWEELHAFFERQWKVMATVAVARFLVVLANHIPRSQWVGTHAKVLWDMMMALPVF